MSWGKLYGVGAGPGDPELLTLKAVRLLSRVAVLALPKSSRFGASKAWEIVAPSLGEVPGQERLFLAFPMRKDPERLRPALQAALSQVGARLEAGKDVAFVTEGDPSLFSSFTYLAEAVQTRFPQVEVEVVPGVSSLAAVPAVSGVPLADGHERVAILPGTSGLPDLEAALDAFDTVVLMKIGPEMPRVIEILARRDLLDRAVYVSRATMAEQRIVRDLRRVGHERGDCFAMVVIAKKDRAGVLLGRSAPGAIAARAERGAEDGS